MEIPTPPSEPNEAQIADTTQNTDNVVNQYHADTIDRANQSTEFQPQELPEYQESAQYDMPPTLRKYWPLGTLAALLLAGLVLAIITAVGFFVASTIAEAMTIGQPDSGWISASFGPSLAIVTPIIIFGCIVAAIVHYRVLNTNVFYLKDSSREATLFVVIFTIAAPYAGGFVLSPILSMLAASRVWWAMYFAPIMIIYVFELVVIWLISRRRA